VREAIKANLKTPDPAGARCENPRSSAPEKRKLVVDYFTADGRKQELEIGQLSDGFRTHLALVMDLALRMVICNPPPEESGTDIPDGYGTRSYAVVLLDEIDLHLHPSWQHIVLRGLLDAFPNAQFFVTTHSEQVLSSVDSTEEALVLMVETKGGEVVAVSPERPTYGARGQDLLKMMGVPERGPYPITEKLDQYLRLIDDGQGHSQEALALRQELDHTLHPRDTALLGADIELRRQDGIAKRAKKP
jgi:predicted ATP-binding protein involved in virulence